MNDNPTLSAESPRGHTRLRIEILRDKDHAERNSAPATLDLGAIETGLGISRTPLREALHRLPPTDSSKLSHAPERS